MEKRCVYVGGLDDEVTEEVLQSAFISFGDIKLINVPVDQRTQKHRGFAFVEFEDPEDAKAAVDNLHMSELFGKVLKLSVAKPISQGDRSSKPVWEDPEYFESMLKETSEEVDSAMKEAASEEPRTDEGGEAK